MKKTLALLLAVLMVLGLFAGCTPAETNPTETSGSADTTGSTAGTSGDGDKTYTYTDSVSTLASNWNVHTYQTSDDSYPIEFISNGLYTFVFNDALHEVEGMEPYTSYQIIPEMAAAMPVDVTEQVKAEHPEFGIPESATSGYAYTIALNPDATWDDGTPINADTYVESMERLLRAELMNYRATDYYSGQLCIAGAEAYNKSGMTSYNDNGAGGTIVYGMDALTAGADGQYVTAEGYPVYIALDSTLTWLSGDTLKTYVDSYGADYFDVTNWETLVGMMDENGLIPLTDENLALFTPVTTGNPAWGETEAEVPNYFKYAVDNPEVDFSSVGIYKNSDYEITLVLGKSLAGFDLYYNLTSNWIVKTDLYDSCLKESNGVWTSTYCTSAETTPSYGPYVMSSYQSEKAMHFVRNENWYGYTDGKHVYVDPQDGQTYDMYMTDEIDCQVVAESATNKMMFLSGQLMTYALQAEDMDAYRNSEYAYATPADTLFFLILNGYLDALQTREAAADFDQSTTDLETMTLLSFRKAMALVYDRENLAATISPARSGGYGIIGNTYIVDPDTGLTYRETDQAKMALCNFYSVDPSKFESLDAAVDSITGYDPEQAKVFFAQAFDEAIEAGYITDNDGDGISDQTVTIEYALSADSDFQTKTINYLNEKLAEVTAGTPFDGKIVIVKSVPYGNDWSTQIRNGTSDCVLGGWTGARMDPFGLSDLYVNPAYAYDAEWFDATQVELTINVPVNGVDTDVTMTLYNWSDALNGLTVTVDGVDYNFGSGMADLETRLDILAAIEGAVLETYDYIPMLQDASRSLLSQKAFYVVEEYNGVMARGGIQYLRYNYDDAAWAEYVASQGGQLQY